MDLSLLKALSEADAIASSEQEVRQILLEEADRLQKEVRFDGLGSVLIRLNESTGPKVMICAHMDEVGFMVRSISREGAIDVLPVEPTIAPTIYDGMAVMGLSSANGIAPSLIPINARNMAVLPCG